MFVVLDSFTQQNVFLPVPCGALGKLYDSLQLRYGFGWGQRVGRELNSVQELILNEGESFTQKSFNFYPSHPGQELVILSGTHNSAGLLSIAAHWAVPQAQYNSTNQD
ncbi:hypothetical protein F7725_018797 [Dissostichus mawsoni]|uniref:Jacalin-type lectin domain-containing protein n=1 Tax=Dissostichus mawsoni TaxID=36200 RepID=A0A7J5XSK5_DISMA|nr:hypothetical protein F7725_018797 [Dissostichus mawsoni]